MKTMGFERIMTTSEASMSLGVSSIQKIVGVWRRWTGVTGNGSNKGKLTLHIVPFDSLFEVYIVSNIQTSFQRSHYAGV